MGHRRRWYTSDTFTYGRAKSRGIPSSLPSMPLLSSFQIWISVPEGRDFFWVYQLNPLGWVVTSVITSTRRGAVAAPASYLWRNYPGRSYDLSNDVMSVTHKGVCLSRASIKLCDTFSARWNDTRKRKKGRPYHRSGLSFYLFSFHEFQNTAIEPP